MSHAASLRRCLRSVDASLGHPFPARWKVLQTAQKGRLEGVPKRFPRSHLTRPRYLSPGVSQQERPRSGGYADCQQHRCSQAVAGVPAASTRRPDAVREIGELLPGSGRGRPGPKPVRRGGLGEGVDVSMRPHGADETMLNAGSGALGRKLLNYTVSGRPRGNLAVRSVQRHQTATRGRRNSVRIRQQGAPHSASTFVVVRRSTSRGSR